MFASLRQCLALLPARQRWRWAALIPLAIVAAALEALGTAAVFALIKVVGDPAHAATLPGLALVTRGTDGQTALLSITIAIGLYYVVKNLILTLVAAAQSRVVSQSIVLVSRQMLHGYLAVPHALHLRRSSAELMRNSTHSVDVLFRQVLASAVAVFTESFIALAIIAVLMAAAPLVTLITAIVLITVLAVVIRVTRRALARWGHTEHTLHARLLQTVQQIFDGLKEIKLRGRERFFYERFEREQRALVRVQHLNLTVSTASRLLIETVFVCGVLLVIVLVTVRGNAGADIVPLLGLYAYAGFRVIPSLNRILMHANNVRYGLPAAEPVYRDSLLFGRAQQGNGERRRMTFVDRLVLDQVSYSYAATRAPALQHLSLTLRCGESIGIVGPTGAGKSTLIDLVLGLLQPSSGSISADGMEIGAALRWWQSQIGYVPQSVYLIDDSLRRNVAFGLPDEEIDEPQVRAAIRMAQLEPFVASLPTGLDTVVGERGVRLSGGERQRVAIARALYHQPALLIFDEATAALDGQTERALTAAIDALHGTKTLIIVAHRLSTVRGCDRIVLLRHGRVEAEGTYDELFEHNLHFRTLASLADARTPNT
ncbi:MAG TPA: ABC transporter ATP-binding protein [Candidatus Kryptonia bacterium]|nr:ABC transporter ATP-binding protein [Candidatus Kryptonia bacterium]